MRTHISQESTEAKIDLSCDEPMIIKLLMQYLYQEEYEPHLRELTYSTPTIMHGASRLEIIPQSAEDDTWSWYIHEFPHTCPVQTTRRRTECHQGRLCMHHICGTKCSNNCSEFVCTHCTRPAKPEIEGTADELLLHAKMYKIADKYNVIGLKELVQDKFKRACAAFWGQDTFAVAGHHVFTTTMPTDKGLRDIVSDTISKHMELIQKPEVQALLNEHNGLALGILLQKAEENGWVKK